MRFDLRIDISKFRANFYQLAKYPRNYLKKSIINTETAVINQKARKILPVQLALGGKNQPIKLKSPIKLRHFNTVKI